MKKTVLLFAAALITTAAQATILRVSNVVNSGAPYTSFGEAMNAAEEGDTIMLDGSATSYSSLTLTKRVVLMGPGYWRAENGIVQEGALPATISGLTVDGVNCIVTGLVINGAVSISASYATITRCHITGNIRHGMPNYGISNSIIHQCYLEGTITGYANNNYNTGVQITNNIFTGSQSGLIAYFTNSYIAYNTFVGFFDGDLSGCTVEKNIARAFVTADSNTYTDNIAYGEGDIFTDTSTDLAIKNITETYASQHDTSYGETGAFAGDDPYVISGMPSGPIVESITVPTSVAQGNTMNVTIKLGVQQ